MPISAEQERRLREEATLENLIAQGLQAVESENANTIDAVRQKLRNFRDNVTTFLDLQDQTSAAIGALNASQAAAGRRQLAIIAEGMSTAGAVFASAALIAESGKESLLFPRLAATAASTLELFKELESAAKKIKEGAANVADVDSLLALIETVKGTLGDLKNKADALSNNG